MTTLTAKTVFSWIGIEQRVGNTHTECYTLADTFAAKTYELEVYGRGKWSCISPKPGKIEFDYCRMADRVLTATELAELKSAFQYTGDNKFRTYTEISESSSFACRTGNIVIPYGADGVAMQALLPLTVACLLRKWCR